MCKLSRLIILWITSVAVAYGTVDHVEVLSRKVLLNGKAFGSAGSYEVIVGRAYFKVKPEEAHNRVVVDLANGKHNAQGEVEFSADLWVLRPTSLEKGNGAMILEIPNRGRRSFLALVGGGSGIDSTKEADWGDGWLLRQGYTVAMVGWQWDLPEEPALLRLSAPVAHAPGRTVITGLLRDDFALAEKATEIPLGHLVAGNLGGLEYPVSNPEDPRNVLTVREAPMAEKRMIPHSEWGFGREEKTVATGANQEKAIVDTTRLHLNGGFKPGKIYELVYVVEDPVVAGLGLAAVRDFVAYVKRDKNDLVQVERAYAFGVSQSGRFLRHFLYQGFNADEQGRQVFDGMMPQYAGAGRGSFNHRFAQPSRDASPMSAFFYPTDVFPFTDLPQRDAQGGKKEGLLDATRASHVTPKIFYGNTAYEYWARAASLTHTSLDGKDDAELPAMTRNYFFTGLQHFPGALPPNRDFAGIAEFKSQYLANPNPNWWLYRAMISNMNAWVRDGIEPPSSAYPKIKDGTLVTIDRINFPKIPGVHFPNDASHAWNLDFGKSWSQGIIEQQPPIIINALPILLPQVDADGNELAGVRLPELRVPLATYTGWNFRDPSIGAPEQRTAFMGSYFPLLLTHEQREAAHDPRPSINERYASEDDYLARYRAAAEELVKERWILPEDLAGVLSRGKQEWQVAREMGVGVATAAAKP